VSRGLDGGGDNAAAVRRLLAALRARDVEATAAELDPEVEAVGAKGSFRGRDAVLGWAKPNLDGQLLSRVEVDEVREVGDRHVAVDARRQWRWKGNDEVAEEERFGALFELRDGRIVGWHQNFPSIVDAIDAI
jgi:ketosteroid isomerase-like protein